MATTITAQLRLRDQLYSPNYGADLTVVGLTYPATTTLDEIERRTVRPEQIMLSADGRHWLDAWHRDVDGQLADAVYVEKHTTGGAVFHGWVDARSRRVVQAG